MKNRIWDCLGEVERYLCARHQRKKIRRAVSCGKRFKWFCGRCKR